MPMGGSATCSSVSWPKIVTTPWLPSVKSPPIGMMLNVTNAGTSDEVRRQLEDEP